MSESVTIEPLVPEPVRLAAARADAMIRESRVAQGLDPAPAPENPAPVPPVSDAAVPEVTVLETPQEAPTPGATVESGPTPTPEPTSEIAELRAKLDAAQQDLRTWKGRYEAELPRERQAREELQRRLAILEEAAARVPDSPPVPESPEITPPTAEEMDAYGADLFDIATRHTMAEVNKRLRAVTDSIESRLAQIESRLVSTSQAVAKTDYDKFSERMDTLVPGWKEIDVSPEFAAWLDEIDPMFGVPRRNALDSAGRSLDSARAAQVLTAFLNQTGARESRAANSPTPSAQGAGPGTGVAPTAPIQITPVQEAQTPTLDDFAAPGRPTPTQPGTPPGQPGARIWTMADITAFYSDRARGAYRDRQAEADRIDRDIALAQIEGRVH